MKHLIAGLFLVAAGSTDPLQLIGLSEPRYYVLIEFDHGPLMVLPGIDRASCQSEITAILDGKDTSPDPSRTIRHMSCERGDAFPRCGDYIVGFNAPAECGGD